MTLTRGGTSRTVDMYSREGHELLASLWLKSAVHNRLNYEPSWLGIPIIQFAGDIVMMQEVLWKVRPDVIVECGVAHGGAAVLYASICELLGKGRVIGVDVEVRKYNRVAIESHPMSKRIEIIEGSSIDPSTADEVKRRTDGASTVMVVLDSNHSRDHVLQELELYHDIVTPGSYLVAMDGARGHVWDLPGGNEEWKDDGPLQAIRRFVDDHADFVIDPHYTRLQVTSSPEGFLRKLTAEELARS